MPVVRSGAWRASAWAALAALAAVLGALVLGGPFAGLVTAALGLQAVVAARAWPAVGRGARTLLVRVLPATVGWLVLALVLDWGLGTVLDRVTGDAADDAVDTLELVDADLPPTDDPRVTVPAYEGVPWVERYFAEMDALEYGYVPFIGPRVEPVHGRYITSADGIRRSYAPPGADAEDALEVWFFGGSTMWGEGQRDDHTIASEVARLAEADGLPVRAVNFGERGYTAYQEFLLFEQELAERGAPDLAVFYDGQNELGPQQETIENLSVQPSIYQLATVTDAFDRAPALPGAGAPPEPSLREDYAETSLFHKLWRAVDPEEPAGAQEEDGTAVAPLDEVTANTRDIYARSVRLLRDLGRRSGTPLELFWQPGLRDNTLYLELAAQRPPGVHDLTDAFLGVPDDDLVFIDGGHTNELGARLVAESMWIHLEPTLRELAAR